MLKGKPEEIPQPQPVFIFPRPFPHLLLLLLLLLFASDSSCTSKPESSNAIRGTEGENASRTTVVITGNTTILSENRTFALGFFSPNGESNWYLGIWYVSVPTPTYVWVANRERPLKSQSSSSLEITASGHLAVKGPENDVVWQTANTDKGIEVRLLETGNLVLLPLSKGSPVWQSFEHPTDTWLPGMKFTAETSLTSWRTMLDPSQGLYSLRLNPLEFNEFQLVFNGTVTYWSTGNWTGKAFTGVPEMTIPYIYDFHFVDPYTPTAAFWYTENGVKPPLSRFQVNADGQLKQYTWSPQTESWNMFWSQPEDRCGVYGLCGEFGFCSGLPARPCKCLDGFSPKDEEGWEAGDYAVGCRRTICEKRDKFQVVGAVKFDGSVSTSSFQGSRSACESSCLSNCSCVGFYHSEGSGLCKNLYGSLLSLKNSSSDLGNEAILYVRVSRDDVREKNVPSKTVVLVGAIVGSIMVLGLTALALLILRKKRLRRQEMEDNGGGFPALNLRVFSYKELQAATKGFSEKLGHGGFGAVFLGELPDSTLVAVKRLERPGSGEKEFRAEVCTIGNIQHVNLVRFRGFCSEQSHRLLVYDYMPNGSLSSYLCKDGPNLSWEARRRIATGTAKGIAYLHEECRDCIIHCDIKPENILLDGDYTPKVSDFGLAKLVGRDFSRVLATMRGTWGYVAPEWISGLAITTKADVYSYGMTLLELVGGRRNVEAQPSGNFNGLEGGAGEKDRWFFPPWASRQVIEGHVTAIVDSRLNGAYNAEEAERFAMVAIWCIQDDETMRPSMGMVVKMLEGVVEVEVPPPPKLIQALVSGESYKGIKVDSSNTAPGTPGYSDYNAGLSSAGSRSSVSRPVSPEKFLNDNAEILGE